ncbi:hypothetical protein ACK2SD_13110 [Pseudomonas sp. SC11]|uniref:hypothetical protein n=1 Tax=Pseudomonas sp. SC11 TaxID=326927 RepID=UPI00399A5E95
MKYLLLIIASYAICYYLVGLLIHGRLADIAEGLRHRPDPPTPGEYLRNVEAHARQSHRHYTMLAGTLVSLVACVLAWAFSR